MNKKQMLKEQKRLKQERRDAEKLFGDNNGVNNLIKITIGVVGFILVAFALINIFNGNWNIFNKSNKKVTEIDPKMVMVGTMFNKEDGEYLVLAYDMQDNNSVYAYLASNYYGSPNLYYLDLSSGFNSNFMGDKTIVSEDLSKLKFSGSTLMLINKDKITKAYTTEDEIVNYFKSK